MFVYANGFSATSRCVRGADRLSDTSVSAALIGMSLLVLWVQLTAVDAPSMAGERRVQ